MRWNWRKFIGFNLAAVMILGGFFAVSVIGALTTKAYGMEQAAPGSATEAKVVLSDSAKIAAFWSAAVATCVSCVAAGVAVGMTGSAAIAAVAERPEVMGRTILFVVFAEGLAIYGLAIAFIILTKV